ncbi:natural cytotoxicity triggering receptor 3-like [Eleutherodactylus coqui]|uniref:natural cytotoxicity triggering receptor 3-like n=1 Tax=Eleutherodactylus coqui TaxID=57060 RepID=UPI00346242CE
MKLVIQGGHEKNSPTPDCYGSVSFSLWSIAESEGAEKSHLHRPLFSFISTVHSYPSSLPSTLLLHLHRPLFSFISTVHSAPSSPLSTLLLHFHRPLFSFVSFSVLCSKMMIRLAALILILGPLQGFLSLEIQVFQVPEVHATPNSDAILPCTYSISGAEEATVGSYKWYRHLVKKELEVSNSNKDFTGRISRLNTDQFINTRSAQITIHNVIPADTATYYCEVTLVHGGEITGHGPGTLLNVTDVLESPSPYETLYIIIVRAVLGVIVVVILLVVGCYRISKQGDYCRVMNAGYRERGNKESSRRSTDVI